MPPRALLPVTLPMLLLVLAGCATPASPEPDAPAQEEGPASPPAPQEMALVAEARTEGVACVAPAGACRVVEPSVDVPLPAERPIASIVANVTWTPRDPTLAEMEVFLLTIDENGDWSWEASPDTYWVGTSPLRIESRLSDSSPTQYHLHARAVHFAPDGSEAGLSQEYRVEGIVTFAAP